MVLFAAIFNDCRTPSHSLPLHEVTTLGGNSIKYCIEIQGFENSSEIADVVLMHENI